MNLHTTPDSHDDQTPTVGALIEQIRTIEAENRAYDKVQELTLEAKNRIDECESIVEDLRQQLDEAEHALKEAIREHKTRFDAFAAWGSKKSTHELEKQLEVMEATNAATRADDEAWDTIKQAAAIVGVHPDTIRRMIARGELKAYRFGRRIRIRRQDLDKARTARPITPTAITTTDGMVA